MSKGRRSGTPFGLNDERSTSDFQHIVSSSTPSFATFCSSNPNACRSASKNTALFAPRLSASSPIVPVPEKTSATRLPGNSCPRRSNSVSFTLSVIGRVTSPGFASNFRRRYFPAMIRNGFASKVRPSAICRQLSARKNWRFHSCCSRSLTAGHPFGRKKVSSRVIPLPERPTLSSD